MFDREWKCIISRISSTNPIKKKSRMSSLKKFLNLVLVIALYHLYYIHPKKSIYSMMLVVLFFFIDDKGEVLIWFVFPQEHQKDHAQKVEWDKHEKLESLDLQLPGRAALGFPPGVLSTAMLNLASKNCPGCHPQEFQKFIVSKMGPSKKQKNRQLLDTLGRTPKLYSISCSALGIARGAFLAGSKSAFEFPHLILCNDNSVYHFEKHIFE